jgi:fructosamine-3-kinase
MQLEFVPDLLREVLGARATVRATRQVVTRDDYAVLIADVGSQHVVVKLAGAAAPSWARAEEWDRLVPLTEMVRAAGVRVPEIVSVDASMQRWPVRVQVRTYLDGTTWREANLPTGNCDALFTDFGDTVARLHGIRCNAFGEFGVPSSHYVTALEQRAVHRIPNQQHVELFRALIEAHRPLLACVSEPAFTHDDLNHTNLLVENRTGAWRMVGLVELDSAWAGNPESDLARLELWRGMMAPAFWTAYLARAQVADDYQQRRGVLQLLWCLEYAQPTSDHHEVTAKVCALLGVPPVRFG